MNVSISRQMSVSAVVPHYIAIHFISIRTCKVFLKKIQNDWHSPFLSAIRTNNFNSNFHCIYFRRLLRILKSFHQWFSAEITTTSFLQDHRSQKKKLAYFLPLGVFILHSIPFSGWNFHFVPPKGIECQILLIGHFGSLTDIQLYGGTSPSPSPSPPLSPPGFLFF